MLKYVDIIPFSIRALLCYMMPGKPPNEIAVDFSRVFQLMFKPWILPQIERYLTDELQDPELTGTVLLVLTFSLNRYKYSVDQFEEYPQIKEFVLHPD